MQPRSHLKMNLLHNPEVLEVFFLDNSRSAVDEYASVILEYDAYVRSLASFDQPTYIIIDITQSGLYSLQYAIEKIGKLISEGVSLPPAFFAYITDKMADRMLIERFTYLPNTRREDTRRVYRSHERAAALEWLLSNTLPPRRAHHDETQSG